LACGPHPYQQPQQLLLLLLLLVVLLLPATVLLLRLFDCLTAAPYHPVCSNLPSA
jgi:hypothetical protein